MSRSGKFYAALGIAVILVAALGAGIWLGRAGPLQRSERVPAAATAASEEKAGIVVVDPQAQSRSGIATAVIEPSTFRPEASAYAVVVDLQPLLALRMRHAAAKADVRSAEVALKASSQEYERSRALYSDDRNVSLKAVQSAEAAYRADRAKLDTAMASLDDAKASALQQFGATLGRWAMDPSGRDFADFASRREVVVQVTLPPEITRPAPPRVRLSAPGYPDSTARFISSSPRSDPSSQGRSFFYRTSVPYPAGARLAARIPLDAKTVEGFLVPESAVIWYGNEPWAFVQESADRFARHLLKDAKPAGGAIFTTGDFKAGERVVVTGAQLLHSEELRPKTPGAAGCSDPECDD